MIRKEGTVLIVGVGRLLNYDVLVRTEETWLGPSGFSSSVVVPEAYMFADCRRSQTKTNRLFTYKVAKAKESGLNVVLLAPEVGMLDKRLRQIATSIQLKGAE